MAFPLRSPRDMVGGIYVFGRILDKIRLYAQEQALPPGYHLGYLPGNRTFDERVCKFLGVDFHALTQRTLAGGTDEEIFEWCCQVGNRPSPEQIEIWNGFMFKRGWNDAASQGLQANKVEAGLGHRDDIVTFFDLMDIEEGRAK